MKCIGRKQSADTLFVLRVGRAWRGQSNAVKRRCPRGCPRVRSVRWRTPRMCAIFDGICGRTGVRSDARVLSGKLRERLCSECFRGRKHFRMARVVAARRPLAGWHAVRQVEVILVGVAMNSANRAVPCLSTRSVYQREAKERGAERSERWVLAWRARNSGRILVWASRHTMCLETKTTTILDETQSHHDETGTRRR